MQRVAILALLAVFAFLLVSSKRADTLPPNAVPVPTKNYWHLYRADNQVDGTVEVHDRTGATVRRYYLDGERLYADKDNPSDGISLTYYRNRDFIDTRFDLGTWAGYRTSGDGTESRFQPGIRYSPVRLGFDLVALDAVASRDVAGVGVSLYPPDNFGRFWHHWGVGAWYCAPFNGDQPGLCVGLSFSAKD